MAAPVYELCGLDVAFTLHESPPINEPVIKSSIGLNQRSGVHGFELFDWEQSLKFIEYHLMNIEPRSVEEVYTFHF